MHDRRDEASQRWRSWREAMAEALYGPRGFYRRFGAPASHFRTAAHASPMWAQAVRRLANAVDEALGHPDDFAVVDLGAGGGELLRGLAETSPARWRLLGVDVAPRPDSLPDRVEWAAALPDGFTGLLLAVEWLDVVPVDVVELTDDGPRLVEVNDAGDERLGEPITQPMCDWLARWWPLAEAGDRAEIGLTRDGAWREAVGRLRAGVAVAVDYAAMPARDLAGTLTGYRDGRQVVPTPDGSCDITAHVLMESCAAAVDDADHRLISQREALRGLGIDGRRPSYDGDPRPYLSALSAAGEAAELLDPSGLGGFTWLLHAKGTRLPLE